MKTHLLCGVFFGCIALGSMAEEIKPESEQGKKFVGEQLRAFEMEAEGVLVAKKDAWINLYYTENAPFRLSGKVWLGGASKTSEYPQDLPDGFALFLREWDSLHRYALTSRSLVVKRRLHEGVKEPKIACVGRLGSPEKGEWIPFLVEATPGQIIFRFGKHSGVIKGPLDIDGANKIALASGTKIKDVQLEILEANLRAPSSASDHPQTDASKSGAENSALAAGASIQASRLDGGKLALSFHTVPGKAYRLKFKNDLSDLNWIPLGESIKANGSEVVIQDDAVQPKRFYTVVQEP